MSSTVRRPNRVFYEYEVSKGRSMVKRTVENFLMREYFQQVFYGQKSFKNYSKDKEFVNELLRTGVLSSFLQKAMPIFFIDFKRYFKISSAFRPV